MTAAQMQMLEHWFSFGDSCVGVTEWPCAHAARPEGSLFFLHGRFGSAECWQAVAEPLSKHYRCIAVDLPGFGRSASANERGLSLLEHSELIARLVERMAVDGQPCLLVGHDIGAAITESCAVLSPQRLDGMVLINAASICRPSDGLETGPFGLLSLLRLRAMLKASTGLAEPSRALLQGLWTGRRSRAALVGAFRALSHSWPRHYERQAWRSHLRGMRQPTLLLWGGRDPLNSAEAAHELLLELPEAYLHIESECGHWPSLECPDWVVGKIREFMFRLRFERERRLAG